MSVSLKRSAVTAAAAEGAVKRQCLKKPAILSNRLCSYKFAPTSNYKSDSSSSEDDSEDEDENNDNSCYTQPVKYRKRRSHKKVIKMPVTVKNDILLSKAVAQYSDDEDDEDNHENNKVVSIHGNTELNNSLIENKNKNKNNEESKLRCGSDTSILNVNYSRTPNTDSTSFCVLNKKRYSINVADLVANNHQQVNSHTKNNIFIQQSDLRARSRCLNYVVNTIDEVWSRYCDATTYEEDIVYGYDEENNNVATTPLSYCSDDDGYKTEYSASTSITEYDSEYHESNSLRSIGQVKQQRSMSIMNTINRPSISMTSCNISTNNNAQSSTQIPENLRLQELKDRLTKAKYYLEEFADSDDIEDCINFWKKWDLIKYSTIEFVEEEEEDDVIEHKIEELEEGRYFGSYSN
ncbi:hypothetical protein DAMA08_040660 [Martiniozyma asiatica (nom. inval.)]|nr:hypothetical protein DAMA08_040660 [Martiniozyma asiatica]